VLGCCHVIYRGVVGVVKLQVCKQQAHKVLNYKKAQWDQIEKDLTETYKQLKKDQDKMSLDELC
jgi:hypothetical protein